MLEGSEMESTGAYENKLRAALCKKRVRFNCFVGAFVFALLLLMAILQPGFYSQGNISSILIQSGATAVMAAGQVYVMVSGGIDLSIPNAMMLSGCVGAIVMRSSGSVALGVASIFAVGLLAGLFNGIAVAKFKMMAFVATMITMLICGGLSTLITQSTSIPVPEEFCNIFGGYLGPIHATILIMVLCLFVLHYVLAYTAFGRKVFAVGTNRLSSNTCGLNTESIQIRVFLISGLMASIAALLLVGRLGSSSLSLASDQTSLDVIAAAIVGGASITGGVGTALGAFFGALLITTLSNSLVWFGVDYYTIQIIKGFVFLLITYFDSIRSKLGGA